MTTSADAMRFSNVALEETLRNNYGTGVDADLPEELRFVRGVAAVAKRRFREGCEGESEHPVIFIMSPQDPATFSGATRNRQRVPMLDNGLTALGGSMWFVNYAVTEGVSISLLPEDNDGSLFEILRVELKLGNLPAAVIETRSGAFELRYFPEGIDRPELAQLTDLSKKSISTAEVYGTLNDIYARDLCSPSAQTGGTSPWEDASNLIPSEKAELRIQRALKVGLGERFKGFVVRQEQTQISGRLDLEIEEPHSDDPSTVTRHVLLELKVLRGKHIGGGVVSSSVNLAAITDGLDQAREYRDERNVRASALCCYDMRAEPSGQATFAHVKDDAADWNVELWLWHLFHTDKDYRRSRRPAAQVSTQEGAS